MSPNDSVASTINKSEFEFAREKFWSKNLNLGPGQTYIQNQSFSFKYLIKF